MAQIGSLSVNLGLNSASFISDMQKAAATTAESASAMKASLEGINSTINNVTSGMKGLMAALAVQQIVSFTEKSLSAAAEIGHLSEAMGISTDQFQKYQLAAEQVGISQEKFNQGMMRFTANVGAAQMGTGPLVKSLEVLDPALLKNVESAKSTGAALDLVMAALAAMPSKTEQARLSQLLFGRGMLEAAQMATKLKEDLKSIEMPAEVIDGAKQLNVQLALTETAITNGFTTGVVAAFAGELGTSTDQLKQIEVLGEKIGFFVGQGLKLIVDWTENAVKQWDDLNQKLEKATTIFGVDLLKAINETFVGDDSAIAHAAAAVNDFLHVLFEGHGDLPMLAFDGMTKSLGLTTAASDTLHGSLLRLHDGFHIVDPPGGSGGGPTALSAALEKATLSLQKTNAETTKLFAAISKGPVEYAKLKAQIEATDDAQKKYGDTTSKQAQDFIAADAAHKLLQERLAEDQKIYSEVEGPLQKYLDKIEEIAQAEKDHAISVAQAGWATSAVWSGIANDVLKAGGAITGALTKMFASNKAIALANAVVNTAEAITAAWKNPPGPPWSGVYAAAAAAEGAMQIAAIASAQPGSASAPTTGASSSSSKSPQGAGGAPIQQQAISISLQGDTFGRAQVENLVGQLKLYQADGGSILLT